MESTALLARRQHRKHMASVLWVDWQRKHAEMVSLTVQHHRKHMASVLWQFGSISARNGISALAVWQHQRKGRHQSFSVSLLVPRVIVKIRQRFFLKEQESSLPFLAVRALSPYLWRAQPGTNGTVRTLARESTPTVYVAIVDDHKWEWPQSPGMASAVMMNGRVRTHAEVSWPSVPIDTATAEPPSTHCATVRPTAVAGGWTSSSTCSQPSTVILLTLPLLSY